MPNQHGGKREGAGRKPLGASLRAVTLSLTADEVAWIDAQGWRSRSEAVRRLIDREIARDEGPHADIMARVRRSLAQSGKL